MRVNMDYTLPMKQILTAKLKLQTDPAQFQALRATQLQYRDALNFVSQYSFAQGKISNQRRLQEACYDAIRLQYGLPAQMACNVPRQVGATKATMAGSMAVKVDANYTSKACPMCGYTSDMNRPTNGLLCVCQSCHYTLHADLVGARNVALRTLLVRQDWTSTGVLSVRPDVSSDEAKAARLSRYAELRWSLDTSLFFLRDVGN